MKFIKVNSFAHYEFRTKDKFLHLYVYPEDCPGMGQREAFDKSEGKFAMSLRLNEYIEVDYGGPYTYNGRFWCEHI